MIETLEFIFSTPIRFFGVAILLMIISKWNLIKIINKQDGSLLDRLAEIGKTAKAEKEQQLNS